MKYMSDALGAFATETIQIGSPVFAWDGDKTEWTPVPQGLANDVLELALTGEFGISDTPPAGIEAHGVSSKQ